MKEYPKTESRVKGVSSDSFGLAIAYLVPGLVGMTILAQFIPEIAMWLGVLRFPGPTVGGFLYGTLGAMGTGLTLNALRWMTLDQLHHVTGIPSPTLDFSTLRHHFDAYQGIVDNHFRYYQFYGNMMLVFLALPFAPDIGPSLPNGAAGWGFWGALLVVFYLASRDTLTKYYSRAAAMAFPTLREADGVAPWNPNRLDIWAAEEADNPEAIAAAQFLLSRWNPGCEWECGTFDPHRAFAAWDSPHRLAYLDWASRESSVN